MDETIFSDLNTQSASRSAIERREQLLLQISTDKRLPSLGIAISEINKIESSGQQSVNQLAQFILSDVGLTKDILRLANSASFRHAQNISITTISKAIFILGFDVVKSTALGMMMLKCFSQKDQLLYFELMQSLCASIIARECVRHSVYQDSEEASIAALFKNIGQVMLAAEAPELYQEIMQAVADGTTSLYTSAMKHIGCSLAHFGVLVLQQWNMPVNIAYAVAELPPGEVKKTKHRSEWIKQVAAFSADAAEIVMRNRQISLEPGEAITLASEQCAKQLMKRYGAALDLDMQKLPDLLAMAFQETVQLVNRLGLQLVQKSNSEQKVEVKIIAAEVESKVENESTLIDDFLMSWNAKDLQKSSTYPSGKPHNARDLLLAGVMEMTHSISSRKIQLNELILQLLEILQGSLGFQFVTASFKDNKNERYIARISIGQDSHKKQTEFLFSSIDDDDLFHLALQKNENLMISDTSDPKIHTLRPQWHHTHFPEVKSMMILPLVSHDNAIGLIYADRHCEAPEGLLSDEIALVKTLKGQLLASMSR